MVTKKSGNRGRCRKLSLFSNYKMNENNKDNEAPKEREIINEARKEVRKWRKNAII